MQDYIVQRVFTVPAEGTVTQPPLGSRGISA